MTNTNDVTALDTTALVSSEAAFVNAVKANPTRHGLNAVCANVAAHLALAAIVAASAGMVSACGVAGIGAPSQSRVTEGFFKIIDNGTASDQTKKLAECTITKAYPKLSEQAKKALATQKGTLPPADQPILNDALQQCRLGAKK